MPFLHVIFKPRSVDLLVQLNLLQFFLETFFFVRDQHLEAYKTNYDLNDWESTDIFL